MSYRGAVIGLGWMGMLYDLAQRMGSVWMWPSGSAAGGGDRLTA